MADCVHSAGNSHTTISGPGDEGSGMVCKGTRLRLLKTLLNVCEYGYGYEYEFENEYEYDADLERQKRGEDIATS
jgi:hypothetical protein